MSLLGFAKRQVRTAKDAIGMSTSSAKQAPAAYGNGLMNMAGVAVDAAGQQAGKAYDDVSGASATEDALKQQMAGATKAQGAVGDAYAQGQRLLAPYQQGASENFQNLQNGVNSGAYAPQYQAYQGAATSGQQAPGYGGYQGSMSSGMQAPGMQGYEGLMSSGQQAPTFQGYQGPMSSGGGFDPQYQSYQGPMSSGVQAPSYQAYSGQQRPDLGLGQTSDLGGFGLTGQSFAMPQEFQRQEATTENLQKFANPYLDQIIQKGTNAIQGSAAARGLLQSSGTINNIGDWAATAAQNSFNDAYGKFQESQNAGMADYQNNRNFNADQLGNAYNRFASTNNLQQTNFNNDRSFGAGQNSEQNAYNMQGAQFRQGAFEGDRAFAANNTQANNQNQTNLANFRQGAFEGDRAAGINQSQFASNYGMQGAQFQQGAFEGDRAAGLMQNQNQNAYNMQGAQFNQGAFEGDRAAGMSANQQQNDFSMQNAQFQQSNFNNDRTFNYGANQDQNNWNAQNAQMAQTNFNNDRAFLYGANQDQNNWNAQSAQNQYNQQMGLVGIGQNAAGQMSNLALGQGQYMSDYYTNLGNVQAGATMARGQAQRGLFGDIVDTGFRLNSAIRGG